MSEVTPTYIEFASIRGNAKWIVYAYKFIGLYAIPLLTLTAIVSLTNVFTAGEFAQYPWIKNAWALMFSIAIDVNIVRLFVESKVDKSRWAFTIGIGLCIVTGAALLLEGLQQSIGLSWQSVPVQGTISIIVGLRVLLVIILMAREGRKLGDLVLMVTHVPVQASTVLEASQEQESEHPKEHDTGPIVNPLATDEVFTEQAESEHLETPLSDREQEAQDHTQDTPGEIPIVNIERRKKTPVSKQSSNAQARVYNVLKSHPNATITELVNKAKVSRGYASRIRSQWMSEQLQSA